MAKTTKQMRKTKLNITIISTRLKGILFVFLSDSLYRTALIIQAENKKRKVSDQLPRIRYHSEKFRCVLLFIRLSAGIVTENSIATFQFICALMILE
jgi:hypothetical protein